MRQQVRRLRLRSRRLVRKQKRQVQDITEQADTTIEQQFFRRFGRLKAVRRFVIGWICLVLFMSFATLWQVRGLDSLYLTQDFVPGGTYREGVVGSFTTANPLFATSSVDNAVSRLVFSGLFRIAPNGKIESDLAVDYSVDEDTAEYTVILRQGVRWHDGRPFTADDVVFTYSTIQNAAVKSPLYQGWRGAEVKKIDDKTVVFHLPNAYSAFQYSLTNGIVPAHLLQSVDPADLRSVPFNTVSPVGTGPFKYSTVEVLGEVNDRNEKVTLHAHKDYFGKKPSIDSIVLRTFKTDDSMIKAFEQKEINAMAGLQTTPEDAVREEDVIVHSSPLASQVMTFLNTSRPILSDIKIREGLIRATNTQFVRDAVGGDLIPADGPFLRSHFTYNPQKIQKGFDKNEANHLLDEAGWIRPEGELYRTKDGKRLTINLLSQSLPEYATIVQSLQQQWAEVGVYLDPLLRPEEDMQTAVSLHEYDILLYGISVGYDPDVFPFWHSSQNDLSLRSRTNLSEYKSDTADTALEAGRTRFDTTLRKVKYEPFLDAWIADVPAIALYQPRFLLVTRGDIKGYLSGEIATGTDRFYSVTDWLIRRDKVLK